MLIQRLLVVLAILPLVDSKEAMVKVMIRIRMVKDKVMDKAKEAVTVNKVIRTVKDKMVKTTREIKDKEIRMVKDKAKIMVYIM